MGTDNNDSGIGKDDKERMEKLRKEFVSLIDSTRQNANEMNGNFYMPNTPKKEKKEAKIKTAKDIFNYLDK